MRRPLLVPLLAGVALAPAATAVRAQDRLPSWNEGPSKRAIVEFVSRVVGKGGPDFVPPPERIAGRCWKQNGWSVISMKTDWRRIFPFERK
jgi:hypothetical protein